MNILLRQVSVISPGGSNHNKSTDILIEGGRIAEIRKNITARSGVKVVEGEGLCVSPGWVDMQAAACDPGYEHKENLDSLISAASAGGFTTVCVHSYTDPPLHNKSQIEYLVNRTHNKVVEVIPIGNITQGGQGKDIAEMYDMKLSGAPGFSDHKQVLKDAGTVMRALQYSANIDSFIITHCRDEGLSRGGQMNEGETAVTLGLKGLPAIAEEIMLERNISILEYAGGRLHIPTVSTRGSLELVKKAKARGLHITCGVAAVNLLLDDSVLSDFDTNFKLDPPLRSRKDVQALRNGVENGLIDVIVSDHFPQDTESKELEFDLAEFGMINLQTAFSCALEGLKEKSLDQLIACLTVNPRRILGLEQVRIEEGHKAILTVFSATQAHQFSPDLNFSRSRNSPFFGRKMAGRVVGIINGSKSYFN